MKLLITTSTFGKVNPQALDDLTAAGFEVTLNPYKTKVTYEQSLELLPSHVGLIAGTEKLDADIFDANPQLKYICRLGGGMDSVDQEAAAARGIIVENTPSAHVDGVAEICLGGIIDLHRHISIGHKQMKEGTWKKYMGSLLKNKVVGLVGFGQVARRMVELLQPFRVEIYAVDPFFNNEFAQEYGVKETNLSNLLELADVVSIHIPFVPENKNLIGKAELDRMKKTAMLVNTSRGGIIDEDALLRHMKTHSEFSAYLDVYAKEPYAGALTELDNILLTPHMGSYAKEVRYMMEEQCAANTINYFKS